MHKIFFSNNVLYCVNFFDILIQFLHHLANFYSNIINYYTFDFLVLKKTRDISYHLICANSILSSPF